MFKRIFSMIMLMMISVIGFQSCEDDSNPIGGGIEPELVGCEAAEMYDWNSVQFSSSLDQYEDIWIAFNLEETTLFSIFLDQTGFQCSVYNGCDGENGLGEPIFTFESIGNGVEIGIVNSGEYWINVLNTRNRADFTFRIDLDDITYGCLNDDAINYCEDCNVNDNSCVFNDCNTQYYLDNYGEMVLDCDGNCAPISWIGDGYCDDGSWGIYDENGEIVPVNLMCEEVNWDNSDCEEIPEGCTEDQIEDCNGNCAPDIWVGDGYCDNGSYTFNGIEIFFDCAVFNNDNGDCDGQGRILQERTYPNGRIKLEN